MADASIDALTSPTLKHLREHWWGPEFTEFLTETLRPRPGNRILDVGCGTGTGEVSIGRLHISQLRLVGVDLVVQNVVEARQATKSHNLRASFAAADACHLPFRDAAFDSTYCVAVLQHIADTDAAVAEFARVTRPGGRVLVVEPDNAARYWYSSTPSGMRVFSTGARFFAALSSARGDTTADGSVGPKLPALFGRHGLEPLDVRLFPVSQARLGTMPEPVWEERRAWVERAMAAQGDEVRRLGRDYLTELATYAGEAKQAGPSFVEIQNTMLFATVGQKTD